MTYCPQCGSENEPSARFCLKCGQELAVKTEARGVSEGRGKVRVVLLVLLGFVGLALVGVCAVGGVALFQRYQEEMRVRHYTRGIRAVDTREWDVAVSELQQAGDYLDAQERLGYAEEQLGRLLVLYDRGMTYFHAGEYWDAAWWLQRAADMHPDYKDAHENLATARELIGKIVYVVGDGQGQHLHIMDADGRNQREVFSVETEAGDLILTGVPHHAARILLQTSLYDSTLQRSFVDLYSLDLVSGEATQLENDMDYAWGRISPDGDQVIVMVKQESAGDRSLYLADFDGGNKRVLAAADWVFGCFASSDGERIIASRMDADSEECVIYFTDPLGRSYDEIVRHEEETLACYAYLSWDLSSMIMVAHGRQSGYELYAADETGLGAMEVMSSGADCLRFDPWYSSDSESFVFGVGPCSGEDIRVSYFLSRADGSGVRALPLETEGYWPELSPTLEHALDVSYDDVGGRSGLYIVETNTGERTLLSDSAGQSAFMQSFSPDGRKVVYPERISEGQTAIYVSNLDGSERQLVGYGERPVWLWPRQ